MHCSSLMSFSARPARADRAARREPARSRQVSSGRNSSAAVCPRALMTQSVPSLKPRPLYRSGPWLRASSPAVDEDGSLSGTHATCQAVLLQVASAISRHLWTSGPIRGDPGDPWRSRRRSRPPEDLRNDGASVNSHGGSGGTRCSIRHSADRAPEVRWNRFDPRNRAMRSIARLREAISRRRLRGPVLATHQETSQWKLLNAASAGSPFSI